MPEAITVTVPATTANVGPGFDCLGAALTLYNQFRFSRLSRPDGTVQVQVRGTEADRVARDSSNLVYQAFAQCFERYGRPTPAIAIDIDLGVPLARGLGSSSTAIVGGLMAANYFLDTPMTPLGLLDLATEIEGHPDNVAPALAGGCQLAAADQTGQWTLCPVPWHETIIPVVAIPAFELSTEAARSVLPQTYSRADAIFNIAHLGLLLRGLETGNGEWLRAALCDRIHQPYRQSLIVSYDQVAQAATAAGAYGLVISGAGPTLLALASPDRAEAVRKAMLRAWQGQDFQVEAHCLAVDTAGAQLVEV